MKKFIVTLFFILALFFISLFIYIEIPFVSDNAVDHALLALKKNSLKDVDKGTLIIVDYSQPSHTKRLAVMDLATRSIDKHFRVAHGKNSGLVVPTQFSNIEGSLQSSLGLFKVANTFNGKHGESLRLIGLDAEKNNNAFKRGIIMHSAAYASKESMWLNWKERFRLGRSAGCFVLVSDDYVTVRKMLVAPVYVYAYAKN